MSQEELLIRQIRMSAMHAAIELYCCHKGEGKGSEEISEGQLEELLPKLLKIRDLLLTTTNTPSSRGPDPL